MAINPATAPSVTLVLKGLRVEWTNSTTAGATHTVYRSRGACGVYVPVASEILTPYIDYNVGNGETYAYYIVAQNGLVSSTETATVSLMYVGPANPHSDITSSANGLTDRRGAFTVFAGVVPAGGGEYQRLQRLRGKAVQCGK